MFVPSTQLSAFLGPEVQFSYPGTEFYLFFIRLEINEKLKSLNIYTVNHRQPGYNYNVHQNNKI